MSNKIYFNWNHFKRDSDNDFNAIIVLTHALQFSYNSRIGTSGGQIEKWLYINHIPNRLFEKGFLETRSDGVYNKYLCKEPQSYFWNPYFLTSRCATYKKVIYIYILSRRRLSEDNNYIPDSYVNAIYWNNPFIIHKDKKLYFIPEIAKFSRKNHRTQFNRK